MNQAPRDNKNTTNFVHKSPVMRIAVHGMSELINTRLSPEALDMCLELLESGVHPKALAEIVLHILDVKSKRDDPYGENSFV